jgi:hypothetical protein
VFRTGVRRIAPVIRLDPPRRSSRGLGIEGTRFEDIPDSWRRPLCGVGKEDFELTG